MAEQAIQVKKENIFVRFIVSLVWLAISIGVDIFAIMHESYLVGAIAEFIFAAITFSVPYLRKKGSYTRWWGWLAIAQGIWLIYLMISNGGGAA